MNHFLIRRFIPLAVLLTVVAVTAIAAPRSVEQARELALQQMKNGVNGVRGQVYLPTDGPRLVYSKAGKYTTPCYYVFSAGENSGFTIVSGDDRLPAIVGYSKSGDFEYGQLPENFANFMRAYQDFADNITDEQIAEVSAWKAQVSSHDAVEPFMDAKWNQGAPYNNMCPEYEPGKKSATGCVATAVAQILHYYRYPANLKADIPAYTTSSNRIDMPGIAVGDEYDWGNMPDEYIGSETQTQNDAVAKLMLHVGCALRMDYDATSGAYATPETFTKYFGMDKDYVAHYARASYRIAEWDHMLYGEMTARRPVYYDGQSTGGGHAFVIHGYADGLYYVNWGWGGYCDGYFDITLLNPDSNTGTGASSTEDGYSQDNGMIIGIQPDNGVVDECCAPVFTERTVYLTDLAVNNGNVTATPSILIYNFNPVENTRYVSIGYMDENFQIQNVATPQSVTIKAADTDGMGYGSWVNCEMSFPCVDGIYRLAVIESTDQNNWVFSSKYSAKTSYDIKVQDGTVSEVNSYDVPPLTAMFEIDGNSGGYAGMSNTINVTVSNSGEWEYYEKVYIKVSEASGMPRQNTYVTGITVPVGGSSTFNFSYTPESAGTYNFWILDCNYNEIGKSSIEFKAGEAPELSFVTIKCANASGEKAFGPYKGYMIEMDKVNDTKADFLFEIRNDGGYYEGYFYIQRYNSANDSWRSTVEMLKIPANSTTKFTFTAEGEAGDVVGCMLLNLSVDIVGLTTPNRHVLQGGQGYYSFKDSELCYLAGNSTGVNDVKIDKENDVYYNLRGEKVAVPSKGVYIKNGKKYIFK